MAKKKDNKNLIIIGSIIVFILIIGIVAFSNGIKSTGESISKKIIITNAFRKKQSKLPIKEKNKALENKADYELRMKEENYYD